MKLAGWILISLLTISTARADYSGIVYEQGSNKQKELYKYNAKVTEADGKEHVLATFTDLEGKEVVSDEISLNGSAVLRDEIHQKQTNQSGIMEVKDGRIYFTKTVGDKTSTSDEKLKDTFVVSGNFQRFVKDHWSDIAGGKTVDFRYGVWDRQETVGFEIFKIDKVKVGDKDALVLKMKPSSFLIAALVNPIIFKFAADGSHLLEMNGRVPPKRPDDGRFKDLDAEVVYSYPEVTAAALPAQAAPKADKH